MKYLFILIATLLFSSCGINKLEKKGVYVELPASDYQQYVGDSTVNIIDVRTEKEYQESHIEGAVNASYFSGNFKQIIDTLNLNSSKTTLIYCETQHRSLFAAKILYKKGFDTIIDLDRGMRVWRKENYPTMYPSDTLQ